MNKTDFLTVVERINGLAELYGQKPPTQKAIEFWWEAIKGYMQGDVLGALDDWMRSKPKMPMPSDIVALTASKLSDRIESQAAADKAQEKREIAQMARTPHGRAVLDKIRAVLAERPTRAHARLPEREPGQDDEEITA